MISLGAIASVWRGSGLPIDVVASLVIGWGTAAVVHLCLGSPAGFPSASEVTDAAGELGIDLVSVSAKERQEWGLARFGAVDDAGRPVEVSIYGRDASDAQLLAKLWRFVWYRDSGPTLALTRLQQVEHEAYLTLLAGHAGVQVPDIVVVGTSEDTGDAVLVTRPLPGRPLASLGPDDLGDDTLDEVFAAVARLRAAGIAHGAISGEAFLLANDGSVSIRDLRQASSGASADRLERDRAAAVVTVGLAVGPDRAVAAAIRSGGADQMGATLARLQRAGFDKGLRDQLRGHKELLGQLRDAGAAATGVDPPQLAEVHRVSTSSLLMGLGAVVGLYLIVQEFSGIDDLGATLKSADWWWVGVAFVLAQLTNVAQAVSVLGSVSTPLPFGPTIGLELANAFTGLVAGTVGTTATIIRYFQRRGLAVSVAVSSGVLCSLANMAVQATLFVVAFFFSHSNFTFASEQTSSSGGSSSGSDTTWLLLLLVLGLAAVGAVTLVPRFRHRAVDKLKPQVDAARTNLRELAGQPSKLVRLFGGAVVSQVLFALRCTPTGPRPASRS
jgi:tRNA A-37 threonylcarbamoyl transferase component Bud32